MHVRSQNNLLSFQIVSVVPRVGTITLILGCECSRRLTRTDCSSSSNGAYSINAGACTVLLHGVE